MSRKQLVVKKDNALVNASYTLTLAEQRLILLAVAVADGSAAQLKSMAIPASLYAERFGVTRQAAYLALHEAAGQLFERRFSYQRLTDKGNIAQVHSRWVQSIAYVADEGEVRVRFADDVVPLLCELERRFTHYALEQIAGLTSVYAVRLYELLIAWRSNGQTPVIDLAEFRQRLGVEEGEYPRMTDFKRWVLDAAVKQINQHTDIMATYDQHKRGRSIAGFSFSFTMKAPPARDPNTVDWVAGVTDTEAAADKPARTTISKSQAERLARPGETWEDLYKRLSRDHIIRG